MFLNYFPIIEWIEDQKLKYTFSIKKPDFVLIDGDEIALSLKYDSKNMNAPVVLLKGKHSLVPKLKNLANVNNIPIIENSKLTKLIYTKIKQDNIISEDCYEEVAYIYAKIIRDKTKDKDKDNNENIINIQRKKYNEVLSITSPEKILIELGYNLFSLINKGHPVL